MKLQVPAASLVLAMKRNNDLLEALANDPNIVPYQADQLVTQIIENRIEMLRASVSHDTWLGLVFLAAIDEMHSGNVWYGGNWWHGYNDLTTLVSESLNMQIPIAWVREALRWARKAGFAFKGGTISESNGEITGSGTFLTIEGKKAAIKTKSEQPEGEPAWYNYVQSQPVLKEIYQWQKLLEAGRSEVLSIHDLHRSNDQPVPFPADAQEIPF